MNFFINYIFTLNPQRSRDRMMTSPFMISYLRTLSQNPINSVLNGGMQPETRLFPLGDKPHCYVMLCYDHISRTIGNYFFVEKNWMHSLSGEPARSLCYGVLSCVIV